MSEIIEIEIQPEAQAEAVETEVTLNIQDGMIAAGE